MPPEHTLFISSRCVIVIFSVLALLILAAASYLFSTDSSLLIVRRRSRRSVVVEFSFQQDVDNDDAAADNTSVKQQQQKNSSDDDSNVIDAVYTWVNGSDPLHVVARRRFLPPESNESDERHSASRFADNDELRFSLRSLDQFAPWVRRVFLVTNGQVPSWLDLSSPRIRVVSHMEIFPNRSHLPVFSSNAIEAHLHRIPGLSRSFLYLNDDTFFGNHVVPDDFKCPVAGHKIFLSWDIPHCAPGCPWSHLGDQYCDLSSGCNVSECLFDGGDCIGPNVKGGQPWYSGNNHHHGHHGGGGSALDTHDSQGRQLCAPGCHDADLVDGLCDLHTCGASAACGFDNGFCGIDMLAQIPSPTPSKNNNESGMFDFVVEPIEPLSLLVNFSAPPLAEEMEKNSNIKSNWTLDHAYFNESDNATMTTGCSRIRTAAFSRAANSFVVLLHHLTDPTHGSCIVDFVFNASRHINNNNNNNNNDNDDKSAEHTRLIFRVLISFARINQTSTNTTKMNSTVTISSNNTCVSHNVTTIVSVPVFVSSSGSSSSSEAGEEQGDVQQDRRLLDTFGDSLRFSNLLLISKFGNPRNVRKAPAHMVHLMQREVLEQLWELFPEAWDMTSSSRFRQSNNTMISFLHFYYMMHAERPPTAAEFFAREMDIDGSGVVEEHEVRRVGLLLYEKGVSTARLLENVVAVSTGGDFVLFSNESASGINESNVSASSSLSQSRSSSRTISRSQHGEDEDPDDESKLPSTTTNALLPEEQVVPMPDQYLDTVKRLLQQAQSGIKADLCVAEPSSAAAVTLTAFEGSHLATLLLPLYVKPEYKYELQTLDDVTFFMLRDNATLVRHQLDHVLFKRNKFVCLNDNLNPLRRKSYIKIRTMLTELFESYFPKPSSFELPPDAPRAVEYIWQSPRWALYDNTTERELAEALQHGFPTREEFVSSSTNNNE